MSSTQYHHGRQGEKEPGTDIGRSNGNTAMPSSPNRLAFKTRSGNQQAAIHREDRTCHIGGEVGRKEQANVRHIFRRPQTA